MSWCRPFCCRLLLVLHSIPFCLFSSRHSCLSHRCTSHCCLSHCCPSHCCLSQDTLPFNVTHLYHTPLTSSSTCYYSTSYHSQIDEVGRDEAFDQYALMNVMKDYMYADQATRYQVVKNHFERAVHDAKVRVREEMNIERRKREEWRDERGGEERRMRESACNRL